MMVAWVDEEGSFVTDRYAMERKMPVLDDCQDWQLISGTEVDGKTIFEVSFEML